MAISDEDCHKVDREFLKISRESEATIFYAATINRFPDPKKIFTFWNVFPSVQEAVRLQGIMVSCMGPELAPKIALDYHPHLSHGDSVLVTGLSDGSLIDWYKKVDKIFTDLKLPESEWHNFIWKDLICIIRLVARFLGKAAGSFHHGNLLEGFSFVMNEGKLDSILLHNLRDTGSYPQDVATFWRIIVVIENHLEDSYLASQAKLDTITLQAFPITSHIPLKQYVERIEKIAGDLESNTATSVSQVANHAKLYSCPYIFVFEDIFFWTEEEVFHFLRKYSFIVFNVMNLSEQGTFFGYLDPIDQTHFAFVAGQINVVAGKINDPRVKRVYTYKKSRYHIHGRILKMPRNGMAHINEAGQTLNFPSIRLESDIHTLVLTELDAATSHIPELANGLTSYAFDGVKRFMNDSSATLDDKHLFVKGVEFRRGFKGFDTNPYV